MNKVWVRKLEELQAEEREAAVGLDREIGAARDRYEERRQKLDRKRKSLDLMRDDPVVIVRTSFGPRPTTYHAAAGGCGWKPANGESMLKSEAEKRQLLLCSSWYCRKALREAEEKIRKSA